MNQGWICKIWNDIILRIDYSWNIFKAIISKVKDKIKLTNSATVATVPPIIQPTPILQSGKNSPKRITNPDKGLLTNAGYIEQWKNMNTLGNHQIRAIRNELLKYHVTYFNRKKSNGYLTNCS